MSQEIWKTIVGYSDYHISNYGNIKSFKHKNERFLKLQKDKNGYLCVKLSKNNEREHFFVHRLVASHFINNINGKPQVNHKDGNKQNNHVSNLEWVTNSENQKHAHDTGLKVSSMKGKFGILHKNSKPVIQFLEDGKIIEYECIKEAERISGIYNSNISGCCKGVKKSAGGYFWMYKEDYEKLSIEDKNRIDYKIEKYKTLKIHQLTTDNIFIAEYKSANEANKKTNIPKQNILQCCKNKRKTAGGFVWKFEGE